MGSGIGSIYIHNGTSGGSDIIAALVTKVSNVSVVGRTLMVVDMTIVGLTFFLPFEGDMEARIQNTVPRILYGWITIFIYSYITDMLINTNRQAVQFVIFRTIGEKIADAVNQEAHRGVTLLDGEGWYSKKQVKLLLVWCRKIEAVNIFRIIKTIDSEAFILLSLPANGVYGKGFGPDESQDKTQQVKQSSTKFSNQI